MAGLLDKLGLGGLDERFQRFSTNPLAMGSLGLLLQPRRRPVGTSGFDYAVQGMQTAAQNRQSQAYAQRLEEETKTRQQEQERQARVMQMLSAGATPEERALMASMSPDEFINFQKYRQDITQFQQRQIEAQQAKAQQERQMQAAMEYINSLPEPQRSLAMADPMKYVGTAMESQFGGGQASPADIQKYQLAKNEGFTGSFMDFMSQMRPAPTPIYSAVPTAQGLQAFNQRTGRVENIAPGVLPAAQDPTLAGRKAELTAAGTATGQAQAQAQLGFPQYESIANETISRIDELITHPGMRGAVGAPSPGKAMAFVPGTEQSNFMSLLNSIKGRQFLEAFESLKGGGQITEVEGQKATQAISDMSTAQSEEAFVRSANQFRNIVQKGLERARNKAVGGRAPTRQIPSAGRAQGGVINFEDLP